MCPSEQTTPAIFARALELPDGAPRLAYVNQVCGSNAELRTEVLSLLRAHEQAGNFLGPAATLATAEVMAASPNTIETTAHSRRRLRQTKATLLSVALGICLRLTGTAPAGVVLTTLHSFNGTNGAAPEASLIQGADGWLYGTTISGGTNGVADGGFGTIFRISTNGEFLTLAHLDYGTGSNPQSGVVQIDGSFYGVTDYGGEVGGGAFYRFNAEGYSRLASFFGTNGDYPHGLTASAGGWLYGTAIYGGTNAGGLGVVFKVSTNGDIVLLASFNGANGAHPQAPLLRAADGNFYGTTVDGGTNGGHGTLFRMTPGGDLTSLVSFNGTNGANPMSALVQDADGNICGTTAAGGLAFANAPFTGNGTVFKLTPEGELSTLHFFGGYPADGSLPTFGGLAVGPEGEFYGTTERGGADASGTIFTLNTNGVSRVVYSFSRPDYNTRTNSDGASPIAGLTLASDGNFYGVTMDGGESGLGTIFQLSLVTDPLRLTIEPQGAAGLELSWIAVLGRRYQLQFKDALSETNWADFGIQITATNTLIGVPIAIGPEACRFYRVRQLQ